MAGCWYELCWSCDCAEDESSAAWIWPVQLRFLCKRYAALFIKDDFIVYWARPAFQFTDGVFIVYWARLAGLFIDDDFIVYWAWPAGLFTDGDFIVYWANRCSLARTPLCTGMGPLFVHGWRHPCILSKARWFSVKTQSLLHSRAPEI